MAARINLNYASYALCLLPQCILIIGAYLNCPWLSLLFFFVLLPLARTAIGDDSTPPVAPTRFATGYLRAIPRLYTFMWTGVLPWAVYYLQTTPMSTSHTLFFLASLWVVCSLNTAVAHELIHSSRTWDRLAGSYLAASVGYFHLFEEHMSHHARTGHAVDGDSAPPGISIYRYAIKRYRRTWQAAWDYQIRQSNRKRYAWLRSRLLFNACITGCTAAGFVAMLGWTGILVFVVEVLGAGFSVQAITFLQHWGLTERDTPKLAERGFSWEDNCWMQARVTLNHAYHGEHHLAIHKPYYELHPSKHALKLPASYPVMLIVALVGPTRFTQIMHIRLDTWLTIEGENATGEEFENCLSNARRLVTQNAVKQRDRT